MCVSIAYDVPFDADTSATDRDCCRTPRRTADSRCRNSRAVAVAHRMRCEGHAPVAAPRSVVALMSKLLSWAA